MTARLSEFAPAKINLTLRVVDRRADGYHDLESLVAFAAFGDPLSLEPGSDASLTAGGEFAAASGPLGDNLIMKAVGALAAQVPGLRAGRFTLEKNIPVAAGLGGGSADAAAALRLLAALNGIALDDPRLLAAARAVGADVPVCLNARTKIMRGVGEDLSAPIALPKLNAVLVNPRTALATKDVFAAFDKKYAGSKPLGDVPPQRDPLIGWLARYGNDLTEAAATRAPVIRDVLAVLAAWPGCRLARMSGSGATCFGLFDAADETEAATAALRAAQRNWWICSTMLG